jgi:hypothetical protein
LTHTSSSFCSDHLREGLENYLTGLASNHDSQVARITGISHRHLAWSLLEQESSFLRKAIFFWRYWGMSLRPPTCYADTVPLELHPQSKSSSF